LLEWYQVSANQLGEDLLIIKPLVPHLSNLKIDIQSRHRGSNYQSTKRDLEQLPYTLEASYHALKNLLTDANRIANDFREWGIKEKKSGIIIPGRPCEELAFMIDNFLEAARRTQNALTPYLSKSLRISIPLDMRKLMQKIDNKKIQLQKEIEATLVKYWKNHGLRLMHYRNVSQHHCIVSSDVVLKYDGNKAFLYLSLINNPEEVKNKGPSAIRWKKPFVHAIPFVIQSFFALLEVMHDVTFMLLSMSTNAEQKVQKTEIYSKGVENPLELYEIPSTEWFENEACRCRQARLLSSFKWPATKYLTCYVFPHDQIRHIM